MTLNDLQMLASLYAVRLCEEHLGTPDFLVRARAAVTEFEVNARQLDPKIPVQSWVSAITVFYVTINKRMETIT